ncbi:hypothetical protein MBANPS3_012275 [Mucor bainieri]
MKTRRMECLRTAVALANPDLSSAARDIIMRRRLRTSNNNAYKRAQTLFLTWAPKAVDVHRFSKDDLCSLPGPGPAKDGVSFGLDLFPAPVGRAEDRQRLVDHCGRPQLPHVRRGRAQRDTPPAQNHQVVHGAGAPGSRLVPGGSHAPIPQPSKTFSAECHRTRPSVGQRLPPRSPFAVHDNFIMLVPALVEDVNRRAHVGPFFGLR